jgi:hypothetical protein
VREHFTPVLATPEDLGQSKLTAAQIREGLLSTPDRQRVLVGCPCLPS